MQQKYKELIVLLHNRGPFIRLDDQSEGNTKVSSLWYFVEVINRRLEDTDGWCCFAASKYEML